MSSDHLDRLPFRILRLIHYNNILNVICLISGLRNVSAAWSTDQDFFFLLPQLKKLRCTDLYQSRNPSTEMISWNVSLSVAEKPFAAVTLFCLFISVHDELVCQTLWLIAKYDSRQHYVSLNRDRDWDWDWGTDSLALTQHGDLLKIKKKEVLKSQKGTNK